MDGWVTIGTKLDTKDFDKQIKEAEAKLNDLEATLQMASEDKTLFSTNEIKEMETETEKLKNKLIDLRKKQADIGKVDLSGISSSMSSIIKKVAKWSLAIFSVRSAYSLIRNAVSSLSQYNEQFAVDLEYIRYALASTLQPIIERIVNLVKTLLTYINYIWQAWFNHPLFASAKAFEDMKKSSAGVAKNAKEINKQISSFDEMDILSEDKNKSSGGISLPSFDLGDTNIPIPWWVDWIAENKETVITMAGIIGGLFTASTVAGWLKNIGTLFGTAGGQGLLGLVNTLGQIAIIGGSIYITGKIAQAFLNDVEELKQSMYTINENTRKYQHEWIDNEENINTLIDTQNVRRTAGNKLLQNSKTMLSKITKLSDAELDTVKNVVINSEAILDKEMEIYKQGNLEKEQKEKLLNSLKEQIDYNNIVIDRLREQGVDTTDLVRINDKYIENWRKINSELGIANNTYEDIDTIAKNTNDKIKQGNTLLYESNNWFNKLTGQSAENLENAKKIVYENEKMLDQGIKLYNEEKLTNNEKKALLSSLQTQYNYNQKVIDKLKEEGKETSTLEQINAKIKTNWEKINSEIGNANQKITDVNNTKIHDKDMTISVGADTSKFDKALQQLKKNNSVIFGSVLGMFANGGVVGFANGSLAGLPRQNVIKMASGSVISRPGRGVPITRAIGGEAGAEGIVPLTNAQMMSQLGEAIGKYVNINLTNITKLDNRQIAREQKIINAQNDFAFNR